MSKLITFFLQNHKKSTILNKHKCIISWIGHRLWRKLSFHIYIDKLINLFKLNSGHFELVSLLNPHFFLRWGHSEQTEDATVYQLKSGARSSSSTWACQLIYSRWVATSSRLPSGKLTSLAGRSPLSIGHVPSSIRVDDPASYVRLPECTCYYLLIAVWEKQLKKVVAPNKVAMFLAVVPPRNPSFPSLRVPVAWWKGRWRQSIS